MLGCWGPLVGIGGVRVIGRLTGSVGIQGPKGV